MKQLMKLRLFSLLCDTSRSNYSQTKLEEAYEEFSERLLEKLQTETDSTRLYYGLTLIHLKFAEMRDNPFCEQGKKCLKFYCESNIFN